MKSLSEWDPKQPLFYGGDALHKQKLHKIQHLLHDRDLEALLLLKSEAVRYVTDFYVKGYRPFMELEYFVLVPKGAEPVMGYSSGSDKYRIQTRCPVEETRKIPAWPNWADAIEACLIDHGITQGRVATDILPFNIFLELKRSIPMVEFIESSDIWVDLTAVKSDIEIELIRHAIYIAEEGLAAAVEAIKPGITEIEIAANAEFVMRRHGSEMTPFILAVSSGGNAAIMERLATRKKVLEGELVMLDIGAVYNGYTADMGRTVVVGEPTDEQRKMYRAVHDSIQAAIQATRPGVACAEIDRVAREVIADAGYEEYESKWVTGHQLGYGLHGAPLIAKNVDFGLRPNMVMCLEPRLTAYDRPSLGGVHLEDVVRVTESGAEVLTSFPYDQKLL